MSISDVKALTFDTGGTILDWHSGFRDALAALGAKHGVDADWPALANENQAALAQGYDQSRRRRAAGV